jgi:2TM domain-containing protein
MEDWKYIEARRRVKKVKGFYSNFSSWLVFSTVFIFLNLNTGGIAMWAIFPIMGWGIGVLFHAIRVFGIPGLGKNWEERMIERELDRIDREEQIQEWRNDHITLDSPSSQMYAEEEPPLKLEKLHKEASDSDFV